ncbi:hypothetical protein VXS04_08175 [Photobacterium piscicola]|uniref:hypothetical protein n=1 Tax=Photobacterium piscicola TaxID=1378299 RepID=UPI002E177061|nr:hypothetical protein [Photobacterium piscicola]
MLDSDLKISQWRQQRKKVLFHFIISHYFLGCLGFLGEKTLERLSFSDNDLDLLFAKELLITFMTLSIIIPLVGLFFGAGMNVNIIAIMKNTIHILPKKNHD